MTLRPNQLINRTHVAGAFDRKGPEGPADGVISEAELAAAGIKRVDAEARRVINEGGEQGEAITVNELAKALGDDRVRITSQGAIAIENRRATAVDGAIVPGAPWSFPVVEDLRILEAYDGLVPRLGRYNPSYPDGYYVDRVHDGYEKVKVGTRKVYIGDDADGNPRYREEDVYEERAKYRDEIQYDRLYRDLRRKSEEVLAVSGGAKDPTLVAARDQLRAAVDQGAGWFAHESACRRLYRALQSYDRISVPTRPEALANRLHQGLEATSGAIAEQARIAAEIPVAKARLAIGREVTRLRGASASNFVTGGLAAAAAGGAGAYFLMGTLAGLPLIGAAAGIALVAGAIGWGVAQLFKGSKAKGLEKDLAVLEAIDPEENREEMEQHALAAYRLLDDARTADTLAALRTFEAEARRVETAFAGVKQQAEAQTKSLRTVESWVRRYAQQA